ncbi:MAG: hypothetical protein ACP5XB_07400 [Isosphaeraceae bacterium]
MITLEFLDRYLEPMRRRKFARRIAAELRRAGEPLEFRYDAQGFRLVAEGEQGFQVNLANTYHEYLATPRGRRKAALTRFIRSWIESRKGIPEEFEDASCDLLPGVRNRATFELFKLHVFTEGKSDYDWPYRPLADYYGAGLVYDLPHAMSQLSGSQLTRWGVDFDEAMDVALGNLRELSASGLAPIASGVWQSPWRDNYDASRLLLFDMISACDVEGDPVVMIPNRDTLLLTGSEDAAGLAFMTEAAALALRRPRPIHAMPLRLEYGSWTPYLPSEDHPAFRRMKELVLETLGQDYVEQKNLLETLHARTGEDLFVASYSSIQNKESGRLASFCMWARGVDSLLPRTDLVHLFDPERPEGQRLAAFATWEHLSEVVGELLEPVDLYPERYRVRSFPSEEQIEAIKAGGDAF